MIIVSEASQAILMWIVPNHTQRNTNLQNKWILRTVLLKLEYVDQSSEDLVNRKALIQQVWRQVWEAAFLTNSQVIWKLLAWGTTLSSNVLRNWSHCQPLGFPSPVGHTSKSLASKAFRCLRWQRGAQNISWGCVGFPPSHPPLQFHFFKMLLHQHPAPTIPKHLHFSQTCAVCHSSVFLPSCSLRLKLYSQVPTLTSTTAIFC